MAESGELKKITLALKEVDGLHTADNLAVILYNAIKDWDISAKLGYFVMDNNATNNKMLKELLVRKLEFHLPFLTACLIG